MVVAAGSGAHVGQNKNRFSLMVQLVRFICQMLYLWVPERLVGDSPLLVLFSWGGGAGLSVCHGGFVPQR